MFLVPASCIKLGPWQNLEAKSVVLSEHRTEFITDSETRRQARHTTHDTRYPTYLSPILGMQCGSAEKQHLVNSFSSQFFCPIFAFFPRKTQGAAWLPRNHMIASTLYSIPYIFYTLIIISNTLGYQGFGCFLLLTTLVIACLITIPALSVSFLDNPVVMHTFSAGCGSHPRSLGVAWIARGMLFNRVMRTPFANVYRPSSARCRRSYGWSMECNLPRRQHPATGAPDPPDLVFS